MIRLSDHFTFGKLMRFTLPSIIMVVFTSIYSIVDGFFVSNFVGKTAFAAVNFAMPLLMILGCVGFMFGTGGSALISKFLGEGKSEKANETFSFVVYAAAASGTLLAVLGEIFVSPILSLMGAEGELLEQATLYSRIYLIGLPFYVLQFEFQCLFVTAEKPKIGLFVTLASGFANMILDAVLVMVFEWKVAGAAVATVVSILVGGIIPLVYFGRKNRSLLKLTRCGFDKSVLFKTCTNGSSEFLSNVSTSLVSMLYNLQLMKYAGEDGVSAYGVLMYVAMIFQAIFIGYSVGAAPVVGYNFGAQNKEELRNVLRRSLVIIGIAAFLMFGAGELLSRPLAMLFVGYDAALMEMTDHAFRIFSFSFLMCGFTIYTSSFFTALNDGLISALVSILRTLVFQVICVIVFPLIWKLDGIWISIVAAEVMAIVFSFVFLKIKRGKYGY